MRLVIDIPEWKYKSICEGVEASKRCGVVGIDPDIHEAIYNGTPLPKDHGRLIDADVAKKEFSKRAMDWEGGVIDCVPTITEAETGWIPISEMPPEVGVDVLVCNMGGLEYLAHMSSFGGYFDEWGDEIEDIIAWAPLPEPYKVEEEGTEG